MAISNGGHGAGARPIAHFPSEEGTLSGLLPEIQGHNLAMTVLNVPDFLDKKGRNLAGDGDFKRGEEHGAGDRGARFRLLPHVRLPRGARI